MTLAAHVQRILDADLVQRRSAHASALAAEHRRMADVRQRAEDRRIVAAREDRIQRERQARAHEMVRQAVTTCR